jgi:hypothetical protein
MGAPLSPFGMFRSKSGSGRRTAPRQRQTGLSCNLGEVVDLSTSGMRLRARQIHAGRVDVVLTDYTRPGELTADVVWTKPAGNFHFEIGLKFRKLTRDMAGRIGAIATAHRFRRAI